MPRMKFRRNWDFDITNKVVTLESIRQDKEVGEALANLLADVDMTSRVKAAFPQITLTAVFDSGWDIDTDLAADPAVAWVFIGGDAGNPPPDVAGPVLWAEPV